MRGRWVWHCPRGLLLGFIYQDGWLTVHLGPGFLEFGLNPYLR